jgi:hypothetical protein
MRLASAALAKAVLPPKMFRAPPSLREDASFDSKPSSKSKWT